MPNDENIIFSGFESGFVESFIIGEEKRYVKEILKTFIGKQEQTPPIYSAIKINGKKLYEYARKGQEVKLEPRQIEIYDIELLNINKTEKQIS